MALTVQNRRSVADGNLGLLQEFVRKDPESYREEFTEQFHHFLQTMKLLQLQPAMHRMEIQPLLELVTFLSSVAFCYPDKGKQFAQNLIATLNDQATGLDPDVRIAFCKALITMRNRKIITTMELLPLFFELVKCDDKQLRKFILGALISFVKQHHSKSNKADGKMQNFVYAKLKDSRSVVARTAQLLMIDAFRKGFWRDSKTANVLSENVFHRVVRLQMTAMRFFLGSPKDEEGLDDDSDSDTEKTDKGEDAKTLREVMTAFRHGKKTKKKQKNVERAKKELGKEKKAKKESRGKHCNLEAIQMLYDPQTFVDRLFGCLESRKNEKFAVRLLQIALCARIIGIHKLQTLGFYSYLHRYLQPKQREVTRILLYAAQACHDLVPPDLVQTMVRTIAQNFVTDRNTPEAITVGLNAIREIFANCPFAATEELLQDLAEYKSYKNKNVSMAARGLITLFRAVNPKLLAKRDRGRPTDATKELEELGTSAVASATTEFGRAKAVDFVPGAEILPEEPNDDEEENEVDDEADSDEEGWVDVPDSGDEDEEKAEASDGSSEEVEGEEEWETDEEGDEAEDAEESEEEEEDEPEEEDDEEELEHPADSEPKAKKLSKAQKKKAKEQEKAEAVASKLEKAKLVSESRILTDADFRKIKAHNIRKKMATERKHQNDSNRKRTNDDALIEEEVQEKIARREEGDGLPRLNDIEHFHKKFRRQTKEERQAQVEAGREGREEFGRPKKKGPHVGRTNRELAKRKNYQMAKIRGRNRNRTFRDKQMSLRKYLLRQQGKKA